MQEFYDTNEAAEVIGTSVMTLSRWRKEGYGPRAIGTGQAGNRNGPAFAYPAASVEAVAVLKRCGLLKKAGRPRKV